MPRVLIRCPTSGREIYTGLRMNWFTLDSYDFGRQKLVCPICGEEHEWDQSDAILDEDGGGD